MVRWLQVRYTKVLDLKRSPNVAWLASAPRLLVLLPFGPEPGSEPWRPPFRESRHGRPTTIRKFYAANRSKRTGWPGRHDELGCDYVDAFISQSDLKPRVFMSTDFDEHEGARASRNQEGLMFPRSAISAAVAVAAARTASQEVVDFGSGVVHAL